MSPDKQQYSIKHAKIWQTEPGLVAVYDIRSGNGAGLFLQPRNPHGAIPAGFPGICVFPVIPNPCSSLEDRQSHRDSINRVRTRHQAVCIFVVFNICHIKMHAATKTHDKISIANVLQVSEQNQRNVFITQITSSTKKKPQELVHYTLLQLQ